MSTVLIPLAQGVEELEAVTIIDLLRRANIEVVTAGLDAGPVTGSRKTVLLPDTTLDKVQDRDFDMIVLPGGLPGATHLENDKRVLRLLKKMAAADKYTAAICAAPKVLATAGLLHNKHVTCYPGSLDDSPAADIQVENKPIVVDGKVITSRGPGTAMDFALQLIRLLEGDATHDQVEQGLQRPTSHTQTGLQASA